MEYIYDGDDNLESSTDESVSCDGCGDDDDDDHIGCKHYSRGCRIIAPCCDKEYGCRLCHDDVTTVLPTEFELMHEIDRFAIKEVVCIFCNKRQSVKQICEYCNKSFGNYYCDICKLFDYDDTKGQKHCDKCGLCRVYRDGEYYHCDGCGQCISITIKDTHKCTNITDEMCPICSEMLFISIKTVITNKCGHHIHLECLEGMLKHGNYKCPLCSKSLIDLTAHNKYLDEQIELTQMPDDLIDQTVDILCNECNSTTTTSFHYYGSKCKNCNSYNTRIVKKN